MPDWQELFRPTNPLVEVVARATIMYLFLFVAIRFLLKREGGTLNVADLLVVVAIVDGAQPAFSGDAQSITESALFVLTIIFWSYALNWLSYRFAPFKFLTAAPPIVLVRAGKMDRNAMRRALMSEAELMQQLREEGVDDLSRIKIARLEGDGEVSVITRHD